MIQNAKIISVGKSSESYHDAKNAIPRGDPAFRMSPSALKVFSACASRWRAGYASPPSEAKDFGNLFDCLLLTPDLFDANYVIRPDEYESKALKCPSCGSISDAKKCSKCKVERVEEIVKKPWMAQSNHCKDWLEQNSGREVVASDELKNARDAVASMRADDALHQFLECSQKQVLVRGEWHDKKTGLTIPVECLIDLVPLAESEYANCLADAKTTRNGSVGVWQRFAYQMGYHCQAAMNLDLYNAATAEQRSDFCFLLIENFAPWQTAKRMLSEGFIDLGRKHYRQLLANYAQCLKHDRWPDYDLGGPQGWYVCHPEPWMEQAIPMPFDFERDDAPPEDNFFDLAKTLSNIQNENQGMDLIP